jgi:multimeric flavodoxin WrbA
MRRIIMSKDTESRKILVLLGSPRKNGNSAILARQIIKGAESEGAEVETVFLHGMNISPCQSCYACQKPDSTGCAIDDDMQQIYRKIIAADALVVASPVYWFTMSAQTKLLLDRCFGIFAYDKGAFAGKQIVVAMSYGDTDPFTSGCVNALRTFQDAFRYVGARIAGMVYGSALEAGEISSNRDLMQNAEELGKKLAGGKSK